MRNKKTFIIFASTILVFALIGMSVAASYYTRQCQPMSDTDVQFMQLAYPQVAQSQNAYLEQHPITEGGIELMQQINSIDRQRCLDKLSRGA